MTNNNQPEPDQTADIAEQLTKIGSRLDQYHKFEYLEALHCSKNGQIVLDEALPEKGEGIESLVETLI
jgi:hypothetical protein